MKIQTNWIIFSGVTSSGKTTIANLLINYGYKAPIEIARAYINELQTKLPPAELSTFVQSYEFQLEVVRRGLLLEKELDPNDYIIIDCGLIASFAYFQLRGHAERLIKNGDDKRLQTHLDTFKYRNVYLFEKLPCDDDPCRFSTEEPLREETHRLLKTMSIQQGYQPIEVPKASIEERLQFILSTLKHHIPMPMTNSGLKHYSGSRSLLFFSNGANSIQLHSYVDKSLTANFDCSF